MRSILSKNIKYVRVTIHINKLTMPKVSVAFFGISGFLGNPIIQAFETGKFDDKIELPIKVVTRKELQSTDRIQYIVGNLEYGMVDSFALQLEGVDVIVELLAVDPALFTTVEKIVQKVKPKLFLPSEFGVDIDQVNSYICLLYTSRCV